MSELLNKRFHEHAKKALNDYKGKNMNIEQIEELFDKLNAEVQKATQEMSEKAKPLIEASANRLFERAPEIQKVFWTQYTPYFNDGEPCYFSVGDVYTVLKDDPEVDYYEGSYVYDDSDLERAQKSLENAKAYKADPQAYVDAYLKEYRERWGREYTGKTEYIKPYPADVETAEREVHHILNFMEYYTNAQQISEAFSDFCSSLSKIPDELMQSIYGDSVRVTITREGTETDHYDHY